MAVEIMLLGPPRVLRDGEPVSFDTRKATALLAHLALAERPRSREALCELLWPGHDPEHGRGALRRTLSTLRTTVGEEWIDAVGDGVGLRRGEGLAVDVERFRALAAAEPSVEGLREAVALFPGEFLEGFALRDSPEFDDWHQQQAGELRRELSSALSRLVELLAARGDFAVAIPHARRWLALDTLHEPAHRELIRLYGWSGERAAAVDQYRNCVRTLSRELGVAPLEETAILSEQVSDGSLAPPAPARPAAAAAQASPAVAPPAELPLVGREGELAALVEAHGRVAGDGVLAVIEGEAGIGKTRLARELLARARAGGAAVLAARCHEDEAGLPYGPVVELLRAALERPGWAAVVSPARLADAALLLPELSELRPEAGQVPRAEGPGARARLLDGVAAVIDAACRGSAPGVVLLDDVHAADEATLDTVTYLGRRLRGRPLLLAIAWRSEAVPPGHRLRGLAADMVREGAAAVVRLDRLGAEDVATLVRAAGVDAALERRVLLESEGLPLFVAEYLAALQAGREPDAKALAGEVRGLLGARLGGLSQTALQVLGAGAVIGRSFALDAVREASGRSDEETVGALEELVAQGLVRELEGPSPAYDFRHEKLRALVYEDTSLARRRLLHGRVAAALAPGSGVEAALIASHHRLAGDHEQAAAYHRVAAEHAASVHAHADGLEHLEAALALGHPDAAGLHERMGDLRTLLGDYAGALASYETAAAHAESGRLAAVEQKLGDVHHRRGDWERAEARFRAALDAVPADEPAARARIEADLSLTLHRAGRPDAAEALAREARELAESAGDRRALAQARNMLGVVARGAGQLDRARSELESSLAIAEELGDPQARVAALNNLALASRDAGELDIARELTERALELCTGYGDRHREAALHNNLADIHHAAGRADESMAQLKRAVAIFSEIGADEAERLPEVWKLVSW